MTGKNMVVQHGSDTGHDAADKWMNHRCRFDKNANEGAGGCTCICWHEDHAHREQHLASGVMTNSPVSARYLASTGAFGV